MEEQEGALERAESPRVLLHMPVDVRSVSLVVLATLASLYALRWASAVFIPVMVGILFSYALSPVVNWMQRCHIPRAISAGLLILGIVSGVGATVYSLSDEANKLVQLLPEAARKLHETVRAPLGRSGNTLTTVQKAAAQIEQAA